MFRTAHVLLLLLHIIIYLFLFIINYSAPGRESRLTARYGENMVCTMILYSTAFPFLRINDCDFHLL